MIVRCSACHCVLTPSLKELRDLSLTDYTDGHDYLPRGYFLVSDGDFYTDTKGKMIIHKHDLINAKNHPDLKRLAGCCGIGGTDGPNKTCKNGHEVATERSDCWLAHSVIFEESAVYYYEDEQK